MPPPEKAQRTVQKKQPSRERATKSARRRVYVFIDLSVLMTVV